jgi:hypothetical protein
MRTLAGALALSGLVGVSLPSDAEAAQRRSRSRGHDRGYSSRSYRAPRSSYGHRDRGYTYRSYDRYRYSPRRSYGYRSYRSYRPYVYLPYAYDPYYAYGYDSYYYDDPYGYDPNGYDRYGYNGPYPRYRSGRAHYHGRLFCVRPHLSIRIGF